MMQSGYDPAADAINTAWAAQRENDSLRNRIKTLESELDAIKEWSVEVANTINAAFVVLGIEDEVRQALLRD